MDIRQAYSPSGAVRVEQRFPRFAGFRIAKQPTFPWNKFGMSETFCWIELFSKFVKFLLVQGGNRQEITRKNIVVQGGKLSLIKRSKTRQKESTARMRRRFSALSSVGIRYLTRVSRVYENYVDKGTPCVARRREAIHEVYQLSVMQLLIKISQKQRGS